MKRRRQSYHGRSCDDRSPRCHEVVGAADGLDSILRDLWLDPALNISVKFHKYHIGHIAEHEKQRLPPVNLVVQEEDDETDEAEAVERHVPEQGPPSQGEDAGAHNGAHADHKEDVEDCRADDGADANVATRDEDADEAGEQFRGAAARRHEGRAGHVLRDIQFVNDHLQRRHEELITDDRQGHEHVNDANDIQDNSALPDLIHGEQIRRVFAPTCWVRFVRRVGVALQKFPL